MGQDLRRRAHELMTALDEAIARQSATVATREARGAIGQAQQVLLREDASYKASDYALARAHGHLQRLIGLRTLELSDESRQCWRALDAFVNGPAHADLRGVGGPALI